MNPHRIAAILFFLFLAGEATHSFGQMFGNRRVGQPIDRQQPPVAAPNTGTLEGSERFVRNNRQANQFVGVDAEAAASFVGQVNAGQQTMNIPPAIGMIPLVDRAPLINQPLRVRSPNTPIEPPMQLGFQLPPETIARRVEQAQTAIEQALFARFGNQISVSVVGPIATLRGEAPDATTARLAVMMTQMEPGISAVQNEIVVNSRRSPPRSR